MENIVVDANGGGDFSTVTEAVNFAESKGGKMVINIKNGIYREKVTVSAPDVKFKGEDAAQTIIVFDDGAKRLDSNGQPLGTFRTASVLVKSTAAGFSAENITFQNDAGRGDIAGQAVALYVDCDKAIFRNCRMLGRQDTLLAGPTFEAPSDTFYRQYYENCYIEGDVDFIFGGAVAIFKNCDIYSLNRDKEINGYVTAACTSKELEYGYTLINCRLKGNAGSNSVYLGRPWKDYSKTVYINCFFDEHIHKEGFSKWKNFEYRIETCYYGLYNCNGPNYNKDDIANWINILTEEESKKYTLNNIFKGWNPN